jgi:hypothetical protein
MQEQEIKRQIFIGGCGRSGTTLLGSMLGSHSQCICPPESHFKTTPFRMGLWQEGQIDPQAALDLIQRHWRFKIWQLEIDPADAPKSSYVDLLHWLVQTYATKHDLTGSVWVDHTPENINYAPTLLRLFPDARIVHIVRDGRAVANSIMPLDWGPNTVIKAAAWWEEIVRQGLALEEIYPADHIVRVRYEDLVSAPETTVTALCERLDLAYEPQMLTASGFRAPGYTTGQHAMIGKRPDASRAERWKRALTSRQIEIFESRAAALLRELGYALQYEGEAQPPTLQERRRARITELWRGMLWNRLRWLVRSYPLWLSWDFVRMFPDSLRAAKKAELPSAKSDSDSDAL